MHFWNRHREEPGRPPEAAEEPHRHTPRDIPLNPEDVGRTGDARNPGYEHRDPSAWVNWHGRGYR